MGGLGPARTRETRSPCRGLQPGPWEGPFDGQSCCPSQGRPSAGGNVTTTVNATISSLPGQHPASAATNAELSAHAYLHFVETLHTASTQRNRTSATQQIA